MVSYVVGDFRTRYLLEWYLIDWDLLVWDLKVRDLLSCNHENNYHFPNDKILIQEDSKTFFRMSNFQRTYISRICSLKSRGI